MSRAIIDSSVWSLVFRRKSPDYGIVPIVKRLVLSGEAVMVGAIFQELLTGVKNQELFDELKVKLTQAATTAPTMDEDYLLAAEYSNICNAKGIQGAPVDFLICAIATRLNADIVTTDKDFLLYKEHLPISLLEF